MDNKRVGVFGATSFVGECLLKNLTNAGWHVTAFSRKKEYQATQGIDWQKIPADLNEPLPEIDSIPYWICVSPIWILPSYFEYFEKNGIRRILALSSTSRFTKDASSDISEQSLARRLADAEECLEKWAERKGIEWIILRPTLIYGLSKDKNISEIARFIRLFKFFPVLGLAQGLRQPIHVEDVANACFLAFSSSGIANRAYNISGADVLSYREMVMRIFIALNRRPRMFTVPLGVFRFAVACIRGIPRYKHWSVAMAERMNRNLVFDHSDAEKDFGFHPRKFQLRIEDVS